MRRATIYIIAVIALIVQSCINKSSSEEETSIKLVVTDMGLRDGRVERKKDSLTLISVQKFLKENKTKIPLIQNYFFLCQPSKIQCLREYDVNHKPENIRIDSDRKAAQIRPIPGVYSIEDGPIAKYAIEDEKLGVFESYFVNLEIAEDLTVIGYEAVLIFRKTNGGKPWIKKIVGNEDYLIQSRLEQKEKW